MREIKFRAWDKEKKRMWWNVQNAYDTLEWHHTPNLEDKRSVDSETLYDCSFKEVLEDENLIVMQFTGLKDKNSKEIYEGDILGAQLNSKLPVIHVVSWEDKNAKWSTWFPREAFELLGNIHANPELLK